MTTLCATGHRPQKLGNCWLPQDVRPVIDALAHDLGRCAVREPLTVISGMALGWDTIVACASIVARRAGQPVRLVAAVPFVGQEMRWSAPCQTMYHWLLDHADEVVTLSAAGYSAALMQQRNAWMVDHAEKVLACWDGTSGGTANCVRYAEQRGVPVVNVIARYFGEATTTQ